ncbi:MAG: DNA translocase FtsK [Anaerolineae bacterium]
MRRVELEMQANRIESVLASHRAPTHVTGGVVTPRVVRFHLAPAAGVRLGRLNGLAEELALALQAPGCRIARTHGSLALEVPRADPSPVTLGQLRSRLTRVPPCTAILGLEEQGVPLLLSLPSPDVAHVLIAGATGSGKTVLLRTIVASLAMYAHPRQVQLLLVDPKGRGLSPLAGLPHLLAPLVSEGAEVVTALRWLVREMDRRDRQGIGSPRLVLAIDEVAEAIALGGVPVVEALTRLTQRGREAGVHVVAATQKPTAALLGPLMKANLPVRLVGRVVSADDARVATGIAGSGAERLAGGGDFLLVHSGQALRFQAASSDAKDLEAIAHSFVLAAGHREAQLRALCPWEGRTSHEL